MADFYDQRTNYTAYLQGRYAAKLKSGLTPDAFYYAVMSVDLLRYKRGVVNQDYMFSAVLPMRFEERWYGIGSPQFKVWPNLVDILAHTHIDIESKWFDMLFPTISIRLPKNLVRQHEDAPYVRSVLLSIHYDHDHVEADDPTPCAEKETNRRILTFSCDFAYANAPMRGIIRNVTLKPEETLAACFDAGGDPLSDGDYEPSKGFMGELFKLTVGVAFLALTDHKLVEPDDSKSLVETLHSERARRRVGRTAKDLVFSVGKNLVLPPTTKTALRARDENGMPMKFAHLRAGHMRWQPYGDREDPKYRLKFIAPTVVRPDLPRREDEPEQDIEELVA